MIAVARLPWFRKRNVTQLARKNLPGLLLMGMCVLGSATLHSQVFDNDAGKREKQFIYEVKQIDEFFERFNNDTASFIRRLYKTRGVKYRIDRPTLIKSLFNYETHPWRTGAIDSFVKKALSVQMPSAGNYYGDDWFAEAICRFDYNGRVIDIPVVLRIDTDRNKRSKWVITGVKQTLFSPTTLSPPVKTNVPGKFISPVSHCNYFIALGKAFDDKQNLAAYFDPYCFQKNNASGFYYAILKNQIRFLHVKEIRYHFLQVSNYIFTVENFQRPSLNAGWLISNLTTASAADKQRFRKELLGAQ